jgi:D-lactate dehydrogenase (cytochrome)
MEKGIIRSLSYVIHLLTFVPSARKWAEKDSLFIKLQGSPALIEEGAKLAQTIAEKHNGTRFELALTPEEGESLWSDRKSAYFSGLNLLPGAKAWITDVWCVSL